MPMSKKRRDIAAAAERLFYREGFASVGIDRVVAEAEVALGTLYKHFPSKEKVIVTALLQREAAYLASLAEEGGGEGQDNAILSLFDRLLTWAEEEGGNGCFFLRAASDFVDSSPIRETALAHKRRMLALVEERLRLSGWADSDAARLAPTIFLLLEGAVAAAFTLGDRAAVAAGKEAATVLLAANAASSR